MAHIYAVGGGKGGTGKSFITANIGALSAERGHTVGLIDLDLGSPNLHSFLGLRSIRVGLDAFLDKSIAKLCDTAVPTATTNLFLISPLNCKTEIANLHTAQKLKLIRAIRQLPYDRIFLDLGAGTHFNTLDFFLAAHEGILVFTPESTAVENVLRFIYSAYLRKIKQILGPKVYDAIVSKTIGTPRRSTIGSTEFIRFIRRHAPEKAAELEPALRQLKVNMIVNKFRNSANPALGERITAVCGKYFHADFRYLGNIRNSVRIGDAMHRRTTYATTYPNTLTSLGLSRITRKLFD